MAAEDIINAMWLFQSQQLDRIESNINLLNRRIYKMAIDLAKVSDAEHKLVGKVDSLLALNSSQSAALKDLADQLSAAIAAGTDTSVIQAAIDQLADDMETESAKIDAATPTAAPVVDAPQPEATPVA
jgi:hypothetical protein